MKRLIFSILAIVAVFSIAITGCLVSRRITTQVCKEIDAYSEKISNEKQIYSYGTQRKHVERKGKNSHDIYESYLL